MRKYILPGTRHTDRTHVQGEIKNCWGNEIVSLIRKSQWSEPTQSSLPSDLFFESEIEGGVSNPDIGEGVGLADKMPTDFRGRNRRPFPTGIREVT